MSLAIHPETKVGALLLAYPELEAVLISIAPAFAKLRNPILRRTVAKVATLDQAARIGGVPVRDLVQQLRQAAGHSGLPETSYITETDAVAGTAPSWVATVVVDGENDIDGDALLAQGAHPLGKIRELLSALTPRQTLRLTTSFRPVPLIEAMRSDRIDVHSVGESETRHLTYFHSRGPESTRNSN